MTLPSTSVCANFCRLAVSHSLESSKPIAGILTSTRSQTGAFVFMVKVFLIMSDNKERTRRRLERVLFAALVRESDVLLVLHGDLELTALEGHGREPGWVAAALDVRPVGLDGRKCDRRHLLRLPLDNREVVRFIFGVEFDFALGPPPTRPPTDVGEIADHLAHRIEIGFDDGAQPENQAVFHYLLERPFSSEIPFFVPAPIHVLAVYLAVVPARAFCRIAEIMDLDGHVGLLSKGRATNGFPCHTGNCD